MRSVVRRLAEKALRAGERLADLLAMVRPALAHVTVRPPPSARRGGRPIS